MVNTLHFNTGPQDALLYDNTNSYFSNVGYVRTSNFEMVVKDVQPETVAHLGSSVDFKIPRGADLLGQCDLVVEFDPPSTSTPLMTAGAGQFAAVGWVEALGFAMIDQVDLYVGTNHIEKIKGERLYIENELATQDEVRLNGQVGKTGRPLLRAQALDMSQIATTITPNATTNAVIIVTFPTPHKFKVDDVITIAGMTQTVGGHDAAKFTGTGITHTITSVTALTVTFSLTTTAYTQSSNGTTPVVVDMTVSLVARTAEWDAIFDAKGAKNTTEFKSDKNRLIQVDYHDGSTTKQIQYKGAKVIVPLGLYFSKHPSKYFPLQAIAQGNEIRIKVTFRKLEDLLTVRTSQTVDGGAITNAAALALTSYPKVSIKNSGCFIRAQMFHLTGMEAQEKALKKHVELIELWNDQHDVATLTCKPDAGTTKLFNVRCAFLHPVEELIVVIRKKSEMGTSVDAAVRKSDTKKLGRAKNYFAFQGGGKDPNIESMSRSVYEDKIGTTADTETFLEVERLKLYLNGSLHQQETSPGGLERDYLMERMLPALHSNVSHYFSDVASTSYYRATNGAAGTGDARPAPPFTHSDLSALAEMMDRKEIYVYPFSINPEGHNPAGALNFSKISEVRLEIEGKALSNVAAGVDDEFQVDIYAVHYNFLSIENGRAMVVFN